MRIEHFLISLLYGRRWAATAVAIDAIHKYRYIQIVFVQR